MICVTSTILWQVYKKSPRQMTCVGWSSSIYASDLKGEFAYKGWPASNQWDGEYNDSECRNGLAGRSEEDGAGRWCTVAWEPYSDGNDWLVKRKGCWLYKTAGLSTSDSEMAWKEELCRFRRLPMALPWLTGPILPLTSINGNPCEGLMDGRHATYL